MPQQNINSYDDEIDLFDLFETLWQKKLLVILFAIIGLLLAAAYAFTATQKWQSVAYISQPKTGDIGDYLNKYVLFKSVDDRNKNDDEYEYASRLTKEIIGKYIASVDATDNKLLFAEQELPVDATTDRQIQLNKFIENIAVKETKDLSASYEVSFSAETAELAQKYLDTYLEFTDNNVRQDITESFNAKVTATINSLQSKMTVIQLNAEKQRENKMAALKKAAKAAKAADINELATGGNSLQENIIVSKGADGVSIEHTDSKYLFLLGQKYLQAQLQAEENTALSLPAEYYVLQHELELLHGISEHNLNFATHSYQLSPSLPISRESPKRALIMAAGLILGGFLGIFWVLLKDAIRKRKEQVD